jgi:GDP-L-fucose synthase
MDYNSKIYVAGHRGMVGSALLRRLTQLNYDNIILKTKKELDLSDSNSVQCFFEKEQPDHVFLCAAKVGGIKANTDFKADFIYENLMIQSNVIKNSHRYGVKKLLFLGSSCIYPKYTKIPIKEEYLLGGYLEPTNDAYAIAKIAGIKMCQSFNSQYDTDFIAAMPTNLYGPNDNYDLNTSHVLPAIIRKVHEAKINNKDVYLWGTGQPMREFLYVDDLADACIFLMNNYTGSEIVNIGTGVDIKISDLASLVSRIVGFEGKIHFNPEYPDGTPRKLLDVSKINKLGWSHKISLEDGLRITYSDFLENHKTVEHIKK